MKNIKQHSGILNIIRRENNSVNGNPRYLCFVDGVSFYTAPDSMHGYGITNFKGKPVTVTVGTYYGKATLNTIKGA